jgi:ribosomal protein S20
MSVQGLTSGYGILRSLFSSSAGAPATSATPADSTTSTTAAALSPRDQFRSDLQALFSAVQQGDMTGAQTALQAITSDVTAAQPNGQSGPGKKSSPTSDFQALIDAVNSGDANAAQTALAKLQSDIAAQGGRHHHHHHGGGVSSQSAGSNSSASSSQAQAASTTSDPDGDGR